MPKDNLNVHQNLTRVSNCLRKTKKKTLWGDLGLFICLINLEISQVSLSISSSVLVFDTKWILDQIKPGHQQVMMGAVILNQG